MSVTKAKDIKGKKQWQMAQLLNSVYSYVSSVFLVSTVPTKSLETTCHFPITFNYNTVSYQI